MGKLQTFKNSALKKTKIKLTRMQDFYRRLKDLKT